MLERPGDLAIGFVMPNFGSQLHPHGLEEVPVVHQPGPGHLWEFFFGWRAISPMPSTHPVTLGFSGPAISEEFDQTHQDS